MPSTSITLEPAGSVTVLRLDRPPANAIDIALAEELAATLADLERRSDLGALVLTGTGSTFSAGLDLKQLPTYGAADQQRMVLALGRAIGRLYGFPRPVVAAVNGHAVAGGLILALACDVRVAAAGPFKLGLTEAAVGVPFPTAPLAVVEAELSPQAARAFALTGRTMGPDEALALGAIDEVVAGELLAARALDLARELAALPPTAFGQIKRQLRAAALQRIEAVNANGDDPVLAHWLSAETGPAAAAILRRSS